MRYLLLICLLSFSSIAAARDLKIATVDMQVLFKEYPGTPGAQKKLYDLAEEKKQDLADSEEIVKDLQNELRDPKSALSPRERRLKEEEFARETQDYQDQKNHIEAELALRNQEMIQSITDKIRAIVTNLAKKRGFDLVLDSNNAFYARWGDDLTNEVLRAFSELKPDPDTDSP